MTNLLDSKLEVSAEGYARIGLVSVQCWYGGWDEYTGPGKQDFFEGFCPLHKEKLVRCNWCEAKPELSHDVLGTLICIACDPDNVPPGTHWRGSMSNAEAYIRPEVIKDREGNP